VVVSLDGPPRVETTLDAKTGATVKLQGKIERREGLTGDVTLTLVVPPGVPAVVPVVVKADATAFAVNVVLPPTTAPGEVTGLKLSGTAVADAKQPNIRVKSRDVDVTLIVKPAAK
jgi:hypothetical protein